MATFHIPIKDPKEIIPRLGKKELHWNEDRSAAKLSRCWMLAGTLPAQARAVIGQAPEWINATLLEGIFERETDIPGEGRPSQTDLLALIALADGNAILGVEGKVDEPFGPLVSEWLSDNPSANKTARLTGLCRTLGIDPAVVAGLRYQLFHRCCASIYEAKRFKYGRAMMLVHSFAPVSTSSASPAGFEDFARFASAIGMPVGAPGTVSPTKSCDGIEFRLAWLSDR